VKNPIKTLKVNTGINQKYLEETLTTDITVLESIFDLIDNSIDAARDHLLQSKSSTDKYGLPKTYKGYKIHVRLSQKSICIRDNCLGINENTLSNRAFKIAEISDHKFGIGQYGLGLKRALLKFGSCFGMSTDDGEYSYKMRFTNKELAMQSGIKASMFKSTSIRKTLFIASDIKSDVRYELESELWLENALRMLGIRYAAYIAKGLKISISCPHHQTFEKIIGKLPGIRKKSKLTTRNTSFTNDGVTVFIESGIHSEYIFPTEDGHSLTKNRDITDEYGLYFICNDRVIVAQSTEKEHGWKTKWHSEYNGFVCLVRFVSEDPRKMPWNTLKTALRTDGRLFVETRSKLQPIADSYRQEVKKLYLPQKSKVENRENTSTPEDQTTETTSNIEPTQQNSVKTNKTKLLKPNDWKSLLDLDPAQADELILQLLLEEARNLPMSTFPCTSAILLRSIIEKSLKQFIYKSKNTKNVIEHFYLSSEGKKKNHTDEQKKHQDLEPGMILNWMKDPNVAQIHIPIEVRKPVLLSVKKPSTT